MASKLLTILLAAVGASNAAKPHPHHAPAYTPAPYHAPTPTPYAHPVTPVYGHAPIHGYTPAPPAYGHAPAYGYAPQHPAPYHPAPHAAPHHPKKPSHADYAPPACSKNTTKSWCLEDYEYPAYEIQHAIEYHYAAVASLYKDVIANTENSVDRLKTIEQETYLCPSDTAYVMPLRAINTDGKWRIVVNNVKAHYETLSQTARVEECTTPGSACPLVPECYETKCLQKNIYHRFLVYDPYDYYFPFAIESFKLPSACACYNGAYVEPQH